MSDCDWLIWSREHGAWWKPRRCGYTKNLSEAGRYNAMEAKQICENANKYREDHDPAEVLVHGDQAESFQRDLIISRIGL